MLSEFQTDKALSTNFEGCLANVIFDNQEFDLWRPDVLEGSSSCCEGPVLPPDPTLAIIPGLRFAGMGYLEVCGCLWHYIFILLFQGLHVPNVTCTIKLFYFIEYNVEFKCYLLL